MIGLNFLWDFQQNDHLRELYQLAENQTILKYFNIYPLIR